MKLCIFTFFVFFVLAGCKADVNQRQKSEVNLTGQKQIDYFNNPTVEVVTPTLTEISKTSRSFVESKFDDSFDFTLKSITVQKYFEKVWVAKVEYYIYLDLKLVKIYEVMVSMDGNVLNKP